MSSESAIKPITQNRPPATLPPTPPFSTGGPAPVVEVRRQKQVILVFIDLRTGEGGGGGQVTCKGTGAPLQ